MLKVVKFGGSSMANATQFKKIAQILDCDPERRIIVASACGKADKNDHKVTDLLYLCDAHKKYGMSYEEMLDLICRKHADIINDLNLDYDVNNFRKMLENILKENRSIDELVSRGEYMACLLLAKYIEGEFIDAKEVIAFNYDGSINFEKTKGLLKPYLTTGKRLVIPGFYGSLPNGAIKVMSRGGSDITGAILAAVSNADIYENWTDVSGCLVADPRIIENPKQIKTITYSELRELSYMGANVLHDEAIFPVKNLAIPINVRNTNDPDNPGTMIVEKCEDDENCDAITGITGKRDFTIITANKGHIASEVGFLRKALAIFENYRINIESISIGVDSFSVVVKRTEVETVLYELLNNLKTTLQLDEINFTNNLSLIAFVGRGMKAKAGTSGAIFAQLGKNDINIRTISQGADEISIIVGVDDKDFQKAIKVIYDKFVA